MADRSTLEFNGSVFENTIARHLTALFPDGVVLNDRELESTYLGKRTQIDLIFIHQQGIFVIEAKSWKKWVKGDYNTGYWMGKSQTPEIMRTFSPVNQNFIHIRALRNAIRSKLGKEPPFFHNVVCFPDSTDLDTPCKEVINLSSLGTYFLSLMETVQDEINLEEWKEDICTVTTAGIEKGGHNGSQTSK